MQNFGQDVSVGSGTGSCFTIWGRALALVCRWRWFGMEMVCRWRWFVGGDGCTSLPISKLSPLTHSFLPLQIQILNLFLAHNPENWDLDIVPGNPHRRNSTFDGLHRVSFSTDEDIKPHQNLLNKQIEEKLNELKLNFLDSSTYQNYFLSCQSSKLFTISFPL